MKRSRSYRLMLLVAAALVAVIVVIFPRADADAGRANTATAAVACVENYDCAATQYCKKAIGDCDGSGTCTERPQACIDLYLPVCGCDGVTYNNDCVAAGHGVSIAHLGECGRIEPPRISAITYDNCISELCTSAITVMAADPAGGNLTYTWETLNGGTIIGSGASVQFDPPGPSAAPACAPYQVKITVTSDASGLSASETIDIYVKLAGDADGNGRVDVLDRLLVRNHFGETPASPGWDPRADVNCDGRLDVLDRLTVRNQFGQTGCACP